MSGTLTKRCHSLLEQELGVMDLAQRINIIIFKSLLTTFEASIIFLGNWGSSKNWLKPKTKPA